MSSGKLFTQKHPYYTTTLFAKQAYEFVKWIYYHDNPMSMPRKEKLAKELIRIFETHQSKYIIRSRNMGNAKLTIEQVREIKNRQFDGLSSIKLGTIYGVSYHTITDIWNGKIWKDITT